MSMSRKDQIRALLKCIETGESGPVAVVNEAKYIQHNPETHEGSEGLAALFERLSKTNPRVNVVRAFEDGDFVFAHTEYDFATQNVGFEVFRFEDGQAVEHWDNLQNRCAPNLSGHSMVDGPTQALDIHLTDENRAVVTSFIQTVLINSQLSLLTDFIEKDAYTEHNPRLSDDVNSLRSALSEKDFDNRVIDYQHIHRVLAEGSFVLSVCEGYYRGAHTSFYDLFHVLAGKIVEHWDTTEEVIPKSEWKNDNGKF